MAVISEPILSVEQRAQLRSWVIEFNNNPFRTGLWGPVSQQLGVVPSQLKEMSDDLDALMRRLQTDEPIAEYLPLAKTAIIYMRRITATDVEARKGATFDPTATAEIENRLQPFQDLMGQPWYAEVRAATPPLLSELLTVQRAEQLILRDYDLALPERTYDEKFGILTAPTLFFPDLRHYRAMSALRGRSVSIAYCDIDDFKQFNDRYTETVVDRNLLPRFMSELERHTYPSAHAYRFGGDEYVILFPATSTDQAIQSLAELQETLAKVPYPGIEWRPTISVGVFELTPESDRTDREALDLASEAKQLAKKEGKNRIAAVWSADASGMAFHIAHPIPEAKADEGRPARKKLQP